MWKQKEENGFTILEILLVVALIALVAGMSIPLFQSFQLRNDLAIAMEATAQSVRRAQLLSQSMQYDTTWGVYVATSTVIVFKGSSYDSRDSDFDEVFTVTSTITPAGTTEFVFSKFTGGPQSTGTLTLTTTNNESKNITINEKGMVEY